MKRLYKSDENKVFVGIFGGLGEYLKVDPVLLRLVAVLVCFSTGVIPFVIGYIVASFIVPKKNITVQGEE